MIRDLFVPREIKKRYVVKPISVRDFLIAFEIKAFKSLDPDIVKIFNEIYHDSYRTTVDLLHIFGGRGTGKSLLCELIVVYDALRHVFVKDARNYTICILSDTFRNQLAEDIKSCLKEFGISSLVKVNVVTLQQQVLGSEIDCFICDGAHSNLRLQDLVFDNFVRHLVRSPYDVVHGITTYEAGCEESGVTIDNRRMNVYLKERECVGY